MRKAIYALIGGLVVASCVVPNYEVDDSVDDGAGEGPGGESGEGGTTGGSTTGGSTTGGSTTGGSSGTGGGCSMDLTDCDGECFNLETDAEHCGDCETECATGEVCLEGGCELDCGSLTQCGTSCVDTDTDEMHCGGCDTPCLGTCVGGDCDLSCPDNRLRCGANCCALPPANGTVSCPANQCVFGCATNYNDCNADPAVTECFARDDVAHCGSNCLDCTQPNATPGCSLGGGVGTCTNTCIGQALTCAPVNGKPSCGTWDFESATTEGWSVWDSNPATIPTAADGDLVTRTAFASTGSRSLAVHFVGDGVNRFGIQFKLRVCGSGQAIDLKNKYLTLDVLTRTDNGTLPFTLADGHNYFELFNGSTYLVGTGDFDMASDEVIWIKGTLPIFADTPALTDIVFWFRVFKPWTGWVYIDNVRIQDCTPQICTWL
jgi:hypothetical protein